MQRALVGLTVATLTVGCKQAAKDPPGPEKQDRPARWKKDLTRDCPAYARGAEVTVDDLAGGVRVIVTSLGDDEVAAIRLNARYLEQASAAGAGADALHFGDGPTGNRNANCPVVLDDTTLLVADIPGGVTIEVRPRDPAGLDALRRTTRERLDTLTIMKEAFRSAPPP